MSKSAIILAGGEGKRMRSQKPKTLCEVLGKPMLGWVMDAVRGADINDICVIKGYAKEYIDEYLQNLDFVVETAYQAERLGTGHAVMMAKDFLKANKGSVVILGGDAPFMDADTIAQAYKKHCEDNASATVISAVIDDASGYGRIVREADGSLKAIVEQKDADEATLQIKEINSGGYWFDSEALLSVLDRITADNNAKEYYLPDALSLLIKDGKRVSVYIAENSDTVLGANDPDQLKGLEEIAKAKGYGA